MDVINEHNYLVMDNKKFVVFLLRSTAIHMLESGWCRAESSTSCFYQLIRFPFEAAELIRNMITKPIR